MKLSQFLSIFCQISSSEQDKTTIIYKLGNKKASSQKMFYTRNKRHFLHPQTINPHLFCSVCLDVFQQPNRLSCGHTYCYICIQNCVKSSKKHICPQCKGDFSRRKLEKDLLASKMVDDLDVRCMHDGCKFACKNSVLKKHQRNCEYRGKKQCNVSDGKLVQIKQQEQEVVEVCEYELAAIIPPKLTTAVMECQHSQSESSVL